MRQPDADHLHYPHYQREVLKYITEIGTSLRLDMNLDTLLERVSEATCKALGFRASALYLSDDTGYFRVYATTEITTEQEEYLHQHPLPEDIVAQFVAEQYRISDSYFIPAEAPLWQDRSIANFFVVDESTVSPPHADASWLSSAAYWHPEDLIVVPLVNSDDYLLGFLTPDAPLDGLRPTVETMTLLELFANQAAVAIEGARLYAGLREALHQAQESERLKNQFLSVASHELRTPLTAIQGYLELLSTFGDNLDEASKTRFLNNARRACEELVLLLGNVMDTSRVDQDSISLKMGAVSVLQSVQLILEILEPVLSGEKREVQVHVPDDLRVWVDELRLRQILLNVVGNVLKYTPPASGIAISAESMSGENLCQRRLQHISYSLPQAQHYGVLAIRDWGPGIAMEDQAQLFTKFMRLSNSPTNGQRGVGLGLYLCRQLAEAMGGYIWVESQGIPGEGSTFFIALPASEDGR